MAEFSLGANLTKMSPEELSNQVAKMIKTLNWLLRNLDSLNVTEINTNLTTVSSEDGETVINGPVLEMYDKQSPAVLRLKQGYDDVTGDFLFELYNKAGAKTVEIDSNGNATFTGGTVRTGDATSDRIELSGGKFRGITSNGYVTGLYFDIGSIAGTGIADVALYHNDSELLLFYDDVTQYIIRPGADASSMIIGATGKTTYAQGDWDFSSASILGLSTNSDGSHDHGGAVPSDGSHSHSVS